MITIHLPDREPLRALYNGEGHLTDAYAAHSAEGEYAAAIARAKGWHEEEYFAQAVNDTRSRLDAVLRAVADDRSAAAHEPAVPAQPAAAGSGVLLNLVAARGGNRPTVGYLVADVNQNAVWAPSLRVAVITKETQHPTSVFAKISKDHVEVSVGHLRQTALTLNPVKVTAKQTSHQRWLKDLWVKVNHALSASIAPKSAESDFAPVATSSDFGIEPREMLKLVILLHSPHWAAFPISAEAKLGQLKALGLQVPPTRNALGTIIDRMEVETE